MNRGRVGKKDYQKILKDMPPDKLYGSHSKNLNELLDEKTGISYTMAFFNDKSLSPNSNNKDHKYDRFSKELLYAGTHNKTIYGKERQLEKRIKTMQRSIDLH